MAAKNYEAIAKSKIRKPAQRPPRFLVYARNKKGKTKFSLTAPNVLVLDPENGTDQYQKSAPDVWPIERWQDVDEAYNFLKRGRHKYDWVSVDGISRMSNMSLRFVMRQEEERNLDRQPGMVQQRDYGKSGEVFKTMLLNFDTLPMGVIYTAQERLIDVTDDGSEDEDAEKIGHMFVPDLPKGARSSINSIVDVIGRLYVVKAERKVRLRDKSIETQTYPQRRLWIADHANYDTGYRSDHTLPPFVKDPTVEKLTQLIREGK